MATLATRDLVTQLLQITEAEGLRPELGSKHALSAAREIPLGKWFLGGRKAVYRCSCDFDEAAHDVRFRESNTETSWGVPPPAFRVEKTRQVGSEVAQDTQVSTPSGGGAFDIGHLRSRLEHAVRDAGWAFHLDAGRRP
ncbi:MAG: hypothetical protein AB7P99_20980 [Vicinamibacterales bacterium]